MKRKPNQQTDSRIRRTYKQTEVTSLMKDNTYKKKWLWTALLLVATLKMWASTPVTSLTHQHVRYELTTYFDLIAQTQKRYATVTGWASPDYPETLVIPLQVIGTDQQIYNVKKIQAGAFKDSPKLKYVFLKCRGVTSLPDDVFGGSTHLEMLDAQHLDEGWNLCRHIKTDYLIVRPGTYRIYKSMPEWYGETDLIDRSRSPQDQPTVRPAGTASHIFSNIPARQWERSTDRGMTWEVIPNTKTYYTDPAPQAGECRYRVLDKNNMYHPVITIFYRDKE